MTVKQKVVVEKHYFIEEVLSKEKATMGDVIPRRAEIWFFDGVYEGCKYAVTFKAYNFNDWQFLKIVADRIIEIAKKNKEAK